MKGGNDASLFSPVCVRGSDSQWWSCQSLLYPPCDSFHWGLLMSIIREWDWNETHFMNVAGRILQHLPFRNQLCHVRQQPASPHTVRSVRRVGLTFHEQIYHRFAHIRHIKFKEIVTGLRYAGQQHNTTTVCISSMFIEKVENQVRHNKEVNNCACTVSWPHSSQCWWFSSLWGCLLYVTHV